MGTVYQNTQKTIRAYIENNGNGWSIYVQANENGIDQLRQSLPDADAMEIYNYGAEGGVSFRLKKDARNALKNIGEFKSLNLKENQTWGF